MANTQASCRDPFDEEVRLTLRALADPVPATIRVRRALKMLLRTYRLECRDLRPPNTPAIDAPGSLESEPKRSSRPVDTSMPAGSLAGKLTPLAGIVADRQGDPEPAGAPPCEPLR